MGKMKHIREAIWVTRLVQIFQATSFPKPRGTGGGVNGPGPNTRLELGGKIEVGLGIEEQSTYPIRTCWIGEREDYVLNVMDLTTPCNYAP